MRNKLFLAYVIVLCAFFGALIARTESGLKTAETVYFKIVPADPRALLSGDYMTLTYDFEREKGFSLWDREPKELTLYVNEKGVAGTEEKTGRSFQLSFRGGRFRLPHQFYFEEGSGKKYANASYAKMKRLADGRILAAALTDKDLNEI